MSSIDTSSQIPWSVVETLFQTYWTIPLGAVILYYYGCRHFNTPGYPLEVTGKNLYNMRLLTATPPSFLTLRSRYNLYANLYILILIAVFIFIIFFYDIATEITGRFGIPSFPNPGSIESRSYIALSMTCLLSSFPGLHQIDAWILRELHKAASIPDEARRLSRQLYGAVFRPSFGAAKAARANLTRRDTIRVAEGQAKGALEQRICDLLCLTEQINIMEDDSRYEDFATKLKHDLEAVRSQFSVLDKELKSYLREQEKLVLSDEPDVDAFIASQLDRSEFVDLFEQRKYLKEKCDALYRLICLILALSILATTNNSEDTNKTIASMGFETSVPPTPALDWNAIAMVTISNFVLLFLVNQAYRALGPRFGFQLPDPLSGTSAFLRFAFAYTLGYALVMTIVIVLKRRWRGESPDVKRAPEELITAACAYVSTLPINIAIGYAIRHQFTYAPFLFALNQAVVGCFIGLYIDRSQRQSAKNFSVSLPALQGCLQAITAWIAVACAPPIAGVSLDPKFPIFQAASSGFLLGLLFQYFYGQYIGGHILTERRLAPPLSNELSEGPA